MSSIIEILRNLDQIDIKLEVFYCCDASTQKELIGVNPVRDNSDVMFQEGSSTCCGYAYGNTFDEALRDVWYQLWSAKYIITHKNISDWNDDTVPPIWEEKTKRERYFWNGHFFEEYVKDE
ncbi:hypothetical protein [Caulobacter phage Cr30]|uniref:hypothetical protein n=1 Tax=Caulobacter phage Cr30 TaxID=1357714 RepID=UPI0004A9B683|nr:hypothetical protein OZ74_gp181 [Caulobacter phage Cr30]AGS81162.1 hypothetical protein [Caulobacter phage Cr30]